jgi:putative ABC transport system ATP-binding protein
MTENWNKPLVALRDVKKTYLMGKVPVEALRGITLNIEKGEMAAIMGPSGSGKTTLLNILGMLDAPSVGSYRLGEEEVAQLTDRRRSQLRNKNIGFVFQVYNLLPRLTAAENVMIPLVYGGVKKKDRRPRAEAALEAVGLKDRMEHHPSELSGGEQQRVAIARALVNEPSLILADEPTGNLDSKSGAAVMDLIQQLHRERKVTVVLVTHDPKVAARAERTIQLADGVVANGECPATKNLSGAGPA